MKNFGFAAILISLCSLSTKAFGQDEARVASARTSIEPGHVRIVWSLKQGTDDSDPISKKTETKTWQTACANIGKSLTVNQGPWGFGFFANFSCWIDDKKISGEAKKKSWVLEYKETEENVFIVISDSENRKVSEVVLKPSRYTTYFFSDKEFTDIVALKLLDGLPAMLYLPKGSLTKEGGLSGRYVFGSPKGGRKFAVIPPPKNLMAYKLLQSPSNAYSAEVFGTMTQKSLDADPADSKAAKKSDSGVRWQANEELVTANARGGLWLHNQQGRNRRANEMQGIIDESQKTLAAAADEGVLSNFMRGVKKGLLATTASGYVGLRYGPQVLPGDPLLAKTAFLGLIGEVRGGPLSGLRFYYDKVPMTTVTQNGNETSIGWGRFIVGKSFGMNLSKFADRIDLTPKIGLWNFHAKLPAERDADNQVSKVGSFDLDQAISLALEFGIEWSSSWYAIRPWYSFDGAGAISKFSKKRVTSNRIGLDSYWTAGPKFTVFSVPFKTTWLLFGVYETIGLTNTDPKTNLEEGETEITGITFSSGYVGAGLAISW